MIREGRSGAMLGCDVAVTFTHIYCGIWCYLIATKVRIAKPAQKSLSHAFIVTLYRCPLKASQACNYKVTVLKRGQLYGYSHWMHVCVSVCMMWLCRAGSLHVAAFLEQLLQITCDNDWNCFSQKSKKKISRNIVSSCRTVFVWLLVPVKVRNL